MGFSGSRRPARASLIAAVSASIALSCPNTTRLRLASRSRRTSASFLETRLGRNPRHGGDRFLDFLHADDRFALVLRNQHLRGARFVDHVDRLVRKFAVAHVARRKFNRRFDRIFGEAELVELLVVGLEAFQDLDGIGDRGLVHVDLLEAPHERPVLLEMLAILLVGGRTDAPAGCLRPAPA